MLYTDLSQIDFNKYRRFFAFGCSFTGYRWPTWSDILAWGMPHCEYHNVGQSGAGQMYISCQLSQYILHHNIGEGDLVAVMWSTFCREDRYLHNKRPNNWSTPGNIFTAQHEVPQEFVDNYVCVRGMAIRDMAIVHSATNLLKTAEFDSFASICVSFEQQLQGLGGTGPQADYDLSDVTNLYLPILKPMLAPGIAEIVPDFNIDGYSYKEEDRPDVFVDYHPTVQGHADYLTRSGVALSQHVQDRVSAEHDYYSSVTHKSQLQPNHVPCLIL